MNAPPPDDDPAEDLVIGRSRRIAITTPWLLAAVLAVGLGGFFVGDHHRQSPAPVTVTSPAPVTVTPPAPTSTAAAPFTYLTTAATKCSAQTGHQLQLGVEIKNQGNTTVVLKRVTPVFPLKGLKAVKTRRGTCGQLVSAAIANYTIVPGSSVWITTTVEVLVACPGPLPVLFDATYSSVGKEGRMQLTGFGDLGGVPYTGCRH